MTRATRRRLFVGLAAVSAAGLPRPLAAAPARIAPPSDDYVGWVDVPRYFPETGHNVDGDFHTYFWRNGAQDTLGFPLTEEFWLPDDGPLALDGDEGDEFGEPADRTGEAPGAGRMVQYFQRARLEYDLASAEVRRSPLGLLLEKGQPAVLPEADVRYFTETGHNVGQSFLVFFEAAGGVDALGLPISEEVEEYGRPVQWFERVRLEWWPENEPGRQVQYGLIGEEHLQHTDVCDSIPADALAPAEPKPPLREWILPAPPPPPRIAWAPMDVPILYYHQVPAQGALRDQIRAFREAGRQFVTLGQVVAALRGEGALPEKPLCLTFDDGWATQFQNGAPVLQAEGVPATFFVITRYLNETGQPAAFPGYMTWDQVRILKELGHEVESHTQNHPDLDRLHAEDEGAVLAEIWESLAVLERRLGRSMRLFAYPNGRWNAPVAALAARVYRAAAATGGGTFQSQQHLYAMRRIKAEPHYKPADLLKQMGHAADPPAPSAP